MTPACMGGWCAVRARCERHITDDRAIVAERLCEPGEEGNYRLISFRHIEHGEIYFSESVDNVLRPAQRRESAVDHLNELFPIASPAGTLNDALNPAGVPPLPRNPGQSERRSAA